MIKSADMFLRNEGQQLDFSVGKLDLVDIFNNSAETVNKLLLDTGAEDDAILADIKGNAAEANNAFQMFDRPEEKTQEAQAAQTDGDKPN